MTSQKETLILAPTDESSGELLSDRLPEINYLVVTHSNRALLTGPNNHKIGDIYIILDSKTRYGLYCTVHVYKTINPDGNPIVLVVDLPDRGLLREGFQILAPVKYISATSSMYVYGGGRYYVYKGDIMIVLDHYVENLVYVYKVVLPNGMTGCVRTWFDLTKEEF